MAPPTCARGIIRGVSAEGGSLPGEKRRNLLEPAREWPLRSAAPPRMLTGAGARAAGTCR
eukprot:2503224-Alexandrium_andersonii.AAC.1